MEVPRKWVPNNEFALSNEKLGLSLLIRENPWQFVAAENQTRSRPATRTAFVRGFLLQLVTAWRRNDRFSPTALPRSAAFAKASRRLVIVRSPTCNCCGGQRSFPAPKSRVGEEAVMPGQPVALARVFWNPPAIHPRESPAAAGSAAIIRQAQEISRFAEPTLLQFVASRNRKTLPRCAEAVDDVTSLWKPEEN